MSSRSSIFSQSLNHEREHKKGLIELRNKVYQGEITLLALSVPLSLAAGISGYAKVFLVLSSLSASCSLASEMVHLLSPDQQEVHREDYQRRHNPNRSKFRQWLFDLRMKTDDEKLTYISLGAAFLSVLFLVFAVLGCTEIFMQIY